MYDGLISSRSVVYQQAEQRMSRKPKGLQQTYQVRLYPTPEQGRLLMAHALDYIGTVNVLSHALDADLIAHDDTFSTKDFVAVLPSCVKNQALRDARSVFKRSLALDALPVLTKPICQWNNRANRLAETVYSGGWLARL